MKVWDVEHSADCHAYDSTFREHASLQDCSCGAVVRGLSSKLEQSSAAFPRVWCSNCDAPQPMVFAVMKADELNDHDAADILCGKCRLVIATLHADPQPPQSSA